uniref:Uncharacterized protein n=1 Tax=Corvus moneduloides TaxID=1196302 RepID=A0A8C3DIR2_CORMO
MSLKYLGQIFKTVKGRVGRREEERKRRTNLANTSGALCTCKYKAIKKITIRVIIQAIAFRVILHNMYAELHDSISCTVYSRMLSKEMPERKAREGRTDTAMGQSLDRTSTRDTCRDRPAKVSTE